MKGAASSDSKVEFYTALTSFDLTLARLFEAYASHGPVKLEQELPELLAPEEPPSHLQPAANGGAALETPTAPAANLTPAAAATQSGFLAALRQTIKAALQTLKHDPSYAVPYPQSDSQLPNPPPALQLHHTQLAQARVTTNRQVKSQRRPPATRKKAAAPRAIGGAAPSATAAAISVEAAQATQLDVKPSTGGTLTEPGPCR